MGTSVWLSFASGQSPWATISLSRFYRRKGDFIKEKYWYLYGFKRFGAYGAWDYYNDYDEQLDVNYYDDDE
ncbi:MAG: hypothetical protein IJ251_08745 [Oscillospiraceae bacterium]|nr:hypothetical protein [Oscillospiraceae bacterium]